jgi:hypothetical protein
MLALGFAIGRRGWNRGLPRARTLRDESQALGDAEALGPGCAFVVLCRVQVHAVEDRALQIRAVEVGPTEVGVTKVRTAEVNALQVGPPANRRRRDRLPSSWLPTKWPRAGRRS